MKKKFSLLMAVLMLAMLLSACGGDTGSKGGVLVNGRRISGPRLVRIGDSMTFGGVTLTLYNTSQLPEKKRRFQAFLRGQSASRRGRGHQYRGRGRGGHRPGRRARGRHLRPDLRHL